MNLRRTRLIVEGLSLFLGVALFLVSFAMSLVSREKEKLDPREREREGEGHPLACQRIAKVHALDGQGGVPFRRRSSHSQVLLLNYVI